MLAAAKGGGAKMVEIFTQTLLFKLPRVKLLPIINARYSHLIFIEICAIRLLIQRNIAYTQVI